MPSEDEESTLAADLPDLTAVSAFLRALAARVEHDPQVGRQIAQLLVESGLLAAGGHTAAVRGHSPTSSRGNTRAQAPGGPADGTNVLGADPFVVLREQGEPALRAHLTTLDPPSLRQIVRRHHLDPARISARWNHRDRLVGLIVEQVRARADHGKAFERV